VIALSRELGKAGHYPAIDPATSTSRLLDPVIVGAERVEVAERVRAALAAGSDDETARRLRAYLTQPFFVAEGWTHRAGRSVTPDETARDSRALLAGEAPGLSADDLSMTGSLTDAGS
jgi:F-type H+-transporting ATPase subunit beta